MIVGMVLRGVVIERPAADECRGCALSDEMWSMMEHCWASPSSRRPSVAHICDSLHTGATVPKTLKHASEAGLVLQEAPLRLCVNRSPRDPGSLSRDAPQWVTQPKILVVDDDPVTLRLCSKFLQVLKCSVSVAEDGVGAIRQMNIQKYDLVLMVGCNDPYMAKGKLMGTLGHYHAEAGRSVRNVATSAARQPDPNDSNDERDETR
jgi:CheY-like chemotaxis protein